MRNAVTSLLICLLVPWTAWGWEPDPSDKAQVKAAAALEEYLESDKVRAKIEAAYGYAILPTFLRGAAGLGFMYGNGLVIEQDALVGRVQAFQAEIGFTYGFDIHTQIILFRDQQTLEMFQQGRLEFQGRASGTLLAWGGAADPGFMPSVAIYSRTKFGLMVEVAAMLSKYRYRSMPAD